MIEWMSDSQRRVDEAVDVLAAIDMVVEGAGEVLGCNEQKP
jgi:hypothetical protein